MNKLNFETVKNKRKYHKLLECIMHHCLELDSNVGRTTPEKTLKRFISSIVDMSENTDRFVELCYLDKGLNLHRFEYNYQLL